MLETVEWATGWPIWLRIARASDEEVDAVDMTLRAPRERAPDGRGCVYRVPAAEGTVVVEMHRDDHRGEHIRYWLRRDATWAQIDRVTVFETLCPGHGEREAKRAAAERAEAEAALPYRQDTYRQPRGEPRYECGLYPRDDGTVLFVSRSNQRFYDCCRLRPGEVEYYAAHYPTFEA